MFHRMRSLPLIALLLPAAAAAEPPRAGAEIAVNTYTPSDQTRPDVAVDGAGRFVVVWESQGQDGNQAGIFGQRYRADGAPLGAEFQVSTFTGASQTAPRVSANANGRFTVVWTSAGQDGAGEGVFGRVYNAAGTAVGGEFAVNAYTTGNQSAPVVDVGPAGQIVAAWASDGPDGSSLGVRARRFDAAGTPLAGEFAVNTFTASPQYAPAIAGHEDGSFVVVWQSFGQDGSAHGVFGQRFGSGGAPVGAEFPVNTHVALSQETPHIAALGGGAFAVVWQSNQQDGNVRGVFARRFDALGNPAGGEIPVNTFTTDAQQFPRVVSDGEGGFTVLWEGWGGQDGSGAGLFGRAFDTAGAPLDGSEFHVNTYTLYNQRRPAAAMDPDGRFVVAWEDEGQETGYGVRAQRFGDLIFKDGVESGGMSAWSSSVTDGGDLTVSGAAALGGTGSGLRGVVDDVSPLYVQDDSPTGEARYRVRFYLDPNGFDPGEAQLQRRTRTFIAFSDAPSRRVAAVVLRRQNGVYALMGRARLDDNQQADTGFFTISDGPHAVEIDLVRATGPDALDGAFSLWIDGVAVAQLSGLDNSLGEVDFARLGALSVKPAANGTLYWDEFESRRESPVGVID